MFAEALKKVSQYTFPIIISERLFNGPVRCGMGSFIILNEDGWILTSAHIIQGLLNIAGQRTEIDKYNRQKQDIEQKKGLNGKQKKHLLKKLAVNPEWIVNNSYWWGRDGVRITKFHYNNFFDIASGKLEPFDAKSVSEYPVFMNPKQELLQGTSLCRLGFPFHGITASFDEQKNQFIFAPGALPVPRFPIEGIHTRVAQVIEQSSGKIAKFIETSSPGLRGQSGGPIFDIYGRVWALQSRTTHLALGFNPKIQQGSREVEENQFLNVGLGTHVENITEFLNQNNIRHTVSAT
jgi:hypothetical protein